MSFPHLLFLFPSSSLFTFSFLSLSGQTHLTPNCFHLNSKPRIKCYHIHRYLKLTGDDQLSPFSKPMLVPSTTAHYKSIKQRHTPFCYHHLPNVLNTFYCNSFINVKYTRNRTISNFINHAL